MQPVNLQTPLFSHFLHISVITVQNFWQLDLSLAVLVLRLFDSGLFLFSSRFFSILIVIVKTIDDVNISLTISMGSFFL